MICGELGARWRADDGAMDTPPTWPELIPHRGELVRYARRKLMDPSLAEDLVHDVFEAVATGRAAFGGRSALRTWLVGILKHKVVDVLRVQGREVALGQGEDDETDPLEHMAFHADGHFQEAPADWGNPEQDLRTRQFLAVLEACTDKLPPTQGRLFLMREWLELSSEEICKTLSLTPTNLYVQLHRARLRLRECLELNWFARPRTQ